MIGINGIVVDMLLVNEPLGFTNPILKFIRNGATPTTLKAQPTSGIKFAQFLHYFLREEKTKI